MAQFTLQQVASFCGGTIASEFRSFSVDGVCTDSRKNQTGKLFVALVGKQFDGHDYIAAALAAGAVGALSQRPMPDRPVVVVPDTLKALGALARAYRRQLDAKIIGITGSVGKTTTKEMIADVCGMKYRTSRTQGNFNNQIGLPQTILDTPIDCEAAVLEMGMNHSREMSYLTSIAQPDIAVITNIGTMHIEHFGSKEGILKAKLEILEGLQKGGRVVFNGDEPLLWNLKNTTRKKPLYFGIQNDACDVRATQIEAVDGGMHFRALSFGDEMEIFIPAPGMHTVYNALAAICVGHLMNVRPSQIQRALGMFHNTGMRQQIYEKNGFTIIEDCYNAGPESMEAALEVLRNHKTDGRKIAVLGDMLELGVCSQAEHYKVGRLCARCADALYGYGKNSVDYVTGAVTGGMAQRRAGSYATHELLSEALRHYAKPGDVLLFKGSRGMKMERALAMFLESTAQ